MAGIFISYRREDASGHAGRLYDHLSAHFGRQEVFMDVDTIGPGEDFVEVIESKVGSCDVLIAVMGKTWLSSQDADGQRRLDNPEDYVRLEIGSALARNVRVIPVLVDGARIPRSLDLPEPLVKLARRNAVEIIGTAFQAQMENLIAAIEKARRAAQEERGIAAPAPIPVHAAPAPPVAPRPGRPASRFRRWFLLYRPQKSRSWIPRVLFYTTCAALPFFLIAAANSTGGDEALGGFYAGLIAAGFYRLLARWLE